ncbi:hypothetical protein, partial [Vibrio splendidus]|uniref:hypothetical protein n=1 Tax=Vibrio splendidus TaxID=29497 RepID=UPI001A7E160A
DSRCAKHQRLEGSSFNKKPNIRPHLNFYYQNHFVNTWIPYTQWGEIDLENVQVEQAKALAE